MRLEMQELRVFAAVIENNGFQRAAEKLYISQSAVSQAVASLERKLALMSVSARAKLVEKERKRHAGLREVCAVMDKAYLAFDKLAAARFGAAVLAWLEPNVL